MIDPSPSAGSWRIDRRTFLRLMGIGGAGLLASGSLGTLLGPLTATRVAAATGPVDDLALALEFDTERIFRFVSDQIRYEPYAGVLRGAEGTLMARAGNSADQAVLLAALLKASGIECRLVQGPLDAATGDALIPSAVTDLASARAQLFEALLGSGEGGRPLRVPDVDAAAQARRDAALGRAELAAAWLDEHLADMTSVIQDALGAAGVTIPATFTPLPSTEREGHMWVQAATGPIWVDLDPSVPDAASGGAVAAPTLIHEAIPDELRHRITFQVILETVAGGALREETLLEVADFADVLAGRSIGILNIEYGGIKSLGVSILGALEGGTTYVPCMVVGETVLVGSGFVRFGGDPAADPFAEVASGTPGPREGEPVAEWVQVTIASPGAEPVVVRREIFDRLGPAARAAGAPDLATLGPIELIVLDTGKTAHFMPARRTHWLSVHGGTLGGAALGEALLAEGPAERMSSVVRMLHLVREAGTLDLAMPEGIRTFVEGPDLTSLTIDLEADTDRHLTARAALDIWHRNLGTLPVVNLGASVTPAVLAGVAPHLAERALAGDPVRDDPEAYAPSVGAVFEKARRDGIGIRVLQDPTDADGLAYPPDALARMRSAITGGLVAVAPERPVRFGSRERAGWWLVDPVTGRTTDQMDDGRGEVDEYAVTVRMSAVEAAAPMEDLGLCLAYAFIGATLALIFVAGAAGAAATASSGSYGAAAVLAGATVVSGGTAGGLVGGEAAGLLGC